MLLTRRPEAALPVVEQFLEAQLGQNPLLTGEGLSKLALALGGSTSPLARQLLWRIVHAGVGGQVTAIQSLGRVGLFEDVEPLLDLPTRLFDGDLKSSIASSVAAIQSRLKGGAAGALAITEGAEGTGGLSVPQAEGALSNAREDSED